jgi:hypothetical protein
MSAEAAQSDEVQPQTLEEYSAAIAGSLSKLDEAYTNITNISQYCKSAYQQEDKNEIYERTKNYTSDAILNIAYHVHSLAVQFAQSMDLQVGHLDQLAVSLQSLTDRLQLAHDVSGCVPAHQEYTIKDYVPQEKVVKLEAGSDELMPCTAGVEPFVREPISFDALSSFSASSAVPASSSSGGGGGGGAPPPPAR